MADHRICFVGDSFVAGVGDPLCLGWVGRVAQHAVARNIDLTHYNLGIRRNTSRDIAARWLQECSARLPDGCEAGIVFSFGVNDTMIENGIRRVSEEESVANFRDIIRQASARFPVLTIGPPPMPEEAHRRRVAALDRLFAAEAQTMGVPYLSVLEALAEDAHWLQEAQENDGAHPRKFGYDRLAALVAEWREWWFR